MNINKFTDLNQHQEDFLHLIEQQTTTEKYKQKLERFIVQLKQETNVFTNVQKSFIQQLQTCGASVTDDDNISSLYMNLKEANTQLRVDNEKLQKLHDEYLKRIAELENGFAAQKQEFEKQKVYLENTIKMQQQELTKKESAYRTELQVQQGSAALQYDELEISLKGKLEESNRKLRESNQICSSLREELSMRSDPNNSYVAELECKLKRAELQLEIIQGQFYNAITANNYSSKGVVCGSKVDARDGSSSGVAAGKYMPLNTESCIPARRVHIKSDIQVQPPRMESVIQGSYISGMNVEDDTRNVCCKYNQPGTGRTSKVAVPPLMPLGAVQEVITAPKRRKRKLFSLNRTNYFEDTETTE